MQSENVAAEPEKDKVSPESPKAEVQLVDGAGKPLNAQPVPKRSSPLRTAIIFCVVLGGLGYAGYYFKPLVVRSYNTISTDDAYVNGHVTFVAPRVAGQVTQVFVDDNMRVRRGTLLAEIDKEPYRVQVRIQKAAVESAKSDLAAAMAQARGLEAMARSQKWQIQVAIDQVRNKVAALHADVATLESKKATLGLNEANLKRGEALLPSGGISREDVDQRRAALKVAEADVEQSLQMVYADRVFLGLPEKPPEGQKLYDVPANIEQNFPNVRSALANFLQTASQIGLPLPATNATPSQILGSISEGSREGDIEQMISTMIPEAPGVKQAEAKLRSAERSLEQADLNLKYCDVVADIDGVVTRRNVNPGNNVSVGQNILAIRSLKEIWIDANFKETQIGDLRIGQRALLEIDMYGSKKEFEGRITGFTMGTGSTLSLLPAQNATGNFVKVVQRLPVRIEIDNYDPDKDPLFIGLSVTPYVYFKEAPQGPHAGQRFQPNQPLPQRPVDPTVGTPTSAKAPSGE